MNKEKFTLIPLLSLLAFIPAVHGQETAETETAENPVAENKSGVVEFELTHERADFYTNGCLLNQPHNCISMTRSEPRPPLPH